MNIVALTGRITRDLKLHKTSSEKPFVFFTVAVSTINNQTDYIPCVAWNKVAENMTKYLIKGSLVSVSGRIATRKSTYEGKDQYITEVVAQSVTFLDNRKKEYDGHSNDSYGQSVDETKINLDEAFKNPNYNTNISFTNGNSLAKTVDTNAETAVDDDEAIIWDN